MTRYALLLRGVNVGAKNSLPMQSGNAVFGTKLGATELTRAIEHALERYMGRPIATTQRTYKQMKAIVESIRSRTW